MKRKSVPYEENHKYIDEIVFKLCSDCDEWKPLTDEYYYKNKSSTIDGYNPYCKECTKKRSTKWIKENPEMYKPHYTKRNQKPYFKEKMRVAATKQRLEGKQKEWQINNPDKIKAYNEKRKQHKTHDITDEEWFSCLDYFKNSCAYCGLSESNQMKLFNEQFHREHVDHNGSNYIDNCIPACTSCNTSKHDKDFNDWYNEENKHFSKRRLNKIVKWMTKECFKILNI